MLNQELFAKRLRELRKENKLSAKAFSEEVGVSRDTIEKWELGQRLPKDPDQYDYLASLFDVSAAYLKGEIDERGQYSPIEGSLKKKEQDRKLESDEHIQHIMETYRSLSEESRELVDSLIEKLYRTEHTNEKETTAS